MRRLEEIHRKQGFDFSLPDLSDPVFAISSVADDGDVQAAAFLRITAEAFLFLDPDFADAPTRWKTLLRIHEDVRQKAFALGLQDVNLWAPPEVPEGFLRRLKRLGWTEDRPWRTFTFNVR